MWAREVQAALAGDVGERGVGLGPAGQDSGRGDGDVGQRGRGEWPGSCSSFRSVAVPVRAGRRFSRVCVSSFSPCSVCIETMRSRQCP